MGGSSGGKAGLGPQLKSHKNIHVVFLCNTGQDPLQKFHKTTKPASIQCWAIIGLPAKRQGVHSTILSTYIKPPFAIKIFV